MAISDRLNKLTTDITNAYTSIENKLPKILPEGYTQVEYIESTGTQYIDTNYTPVQGDDLEFKNVTMNTFNGALFSAGIGDYQLILLGVGTGCYYKYFQTGNVAQFPFSAITNGNIKILNGNIYIDNILKAEADYGGAVNTTLNVFRRADTTSYFIGKIGEIIISNNGTVKRDFIPCYRNSDNEIGMYDTVNNVFYTNAGTGTFLKGYDTAIGMDKNTNNLSTAIDSIEVIEQATAEGESLSLANTKAMPYSNYVVEGKSEQATRSGKNKCNIINKNISISGASYISNNGIISINGECTLNSSNNTGILKLKANVQYVYSANNSGNLNNSYFVINNNGSYIYFGSNNKTFTVSQDGDYNFDFILVAGNYNNITIKPQVEENTTSTEWEQYGASPSPEYPSDIHSVADDVNLLPYPYSISIYNQNGLKVTFNNDGTMTLNGTTNNVCYVNVMGTGDEKTLKAGTYTLKAFVNGLTRFRLFDVTNTRGFDDTGNGNTFTITEDISYRVYFEIPSNVTFNNAILKPKLQKGTTSTPYSPYNQGTVTIKQRGKNLFDINNVQKGIYYDNNGQHSLSVSFAEKFIVESGETYTYLINNKYSSSIRHYIFAYDKDMNYITNFIWGSSISANSTYKRPCIIPSNVKYLTISILDINPNEVDITEVIEIQLEKGNNYDNIQFEPYQGNDYTFQTEPLRSLPNGVKNTIEAEQHRKIGRQTGTLTETTTITLSDAKTNGAYMCNIKPSGTLTGKTIELEAGDYEIIYELAEEIIEPLTQNQATTMLDIIKTGSYEGTTNIYTDEDVKPTIGVGYYKKG